VVDGLKVLDPERPIREADIGRPRIYACQQLADIYVRNELTDEVKLIICA